MKKKKLNTGIFTFRKSLHSHTKSFLKPTIGSTENKSLVTFWAADTYIYTLPSALCYFTQYANFLSFANITHLENNCEKLKYLILQHLPL